MILTGSRRRGVPVGAIVVIAVSSICLTGFLGLYLAIGGLSFLVAAILSLVTLVPMMAGVLALDRLEPEPRYLLVTTFLWGAGISIALSLGFEILGSVALRPGFGDNIDAIGTVVLAPVVEETMKGLVLFGLFLFRRWEINGITDGIVYAATVALGFAAAENIGYYIGSAAEGTSTLALIFVIRGVVAPFCHPVFTAMTGVALALATRVRSPAGRFFLPLAGLAAAMVLHAIWNGSTLLGIGAWGIAFLIELGVLICLLVAVHIDRKRSVARIQACVAQYLPTGLVTGKDLAMLSSMAYRKLARRWARSQYGKNGFVAMRDYQQACTELSMLHDRSVAGMVTAEVFAGQERDLLSLMHVAREAFLGPSSMAVPMVATSPAMMQVQQPPIPPLGPTWSQ
jgi:RsiW-degrading membrane proteinase PrsW (M82 family)